MNLRKKKNLQKKVNKKYISGAFAPDIVLYIIPKMNSNNKA